MPVSSRETLKELELGAFAELELEGTFRGLCNSEPLSLCRTLLKLILIDDSILFLKTSRGFAGNFLIRMLQYLVILISKSLGFFFKLLLHSTFFCCCLDL